MSSEIIKSGLEVLEHFVESHYQPKIAQTFDVKLDVNYDTIDRNRGLYTFILSSEKSSDISSLQSLQNLQNSNCQVSIVPDCLDPDRMNFIYKDVDSSIDNQKEIEQKLEKASKTSTFLPTKIITSEDIALAEIIKINENNGGGNNCLILKEIIKHGSEKMAAFVDNEKWTHFKILENPLDLRQRIKKSLNYNLQLGFYSRFSPIAIILLDSFQSELVFDAKTSEIVNEICAEDLRTYENKKSLLQKIIKTGDPEESDPKIYNLDFYNPCLSASSEIVETCLEVATKPNLSIGLIHGPPGTGKTTVLVEIILQLLRLGKRVLVSCFSNQAVDNILARFLQERQKIVKEQRRGEENENFILESDITRVNNINPDFQKYSGYFNQGRLVFSTLHAASLETETRLKTLKNYNFDSYYCDPINVNSNFSTTKAGKKLNPDYSIFDITIIDEAGQNFESDCWGAVGLGKKLIVAGDHKQLSPVIINEFTNDNSSSNVSTSSGIYKPETLQERIIKIHQQQIAKFEKMSKRRPNMKHKFAPIIKNCQLKYQFRMHPKIAEWSNKVMYENSLEHGTEEQLIKLSTLDPVTIFNYGYMKKYPEKMMGKSFVNNYEADSIFKYCKKLLEISEITDKNIGIIVPYAAQRTLIQQKFSSAHQTSKIKISSVDGFQGSEKLVIILGLVRSNNRKNVGFVDDLRRMNVATTRARKHLAVFCDVGQFEESDIKEFFEIHKHSIIKI